MGGEEVGEEVRFEASGLGLDLDSVVAGLDTRFHIIRCSACCPPDIFRPEDATGHWPCRDGRSTDYRTFRIVLSQHTF